MPAGYMILNLVRPHLNLKLQTKQSSLIQTVILYIPIANVHDSCQIFAFFSVNIYGKFSPVLLIYGGLEMIGTVQQQNLRRLSILHSARIVGLMRVLSPLNNCPFSCKKAKGFGI